MKRNSLALFLVSTFVAIVLLWTQRVDLLLGVISYQKKLNMMSQLDLYHTTEQV